MAEYIQITDNIIKLVKYTTIDSYEDGLSKLNIIHHFIIEQINQQNHINKYMINKTDILSEINNDLNIKIKIEEFEDIKDEPIINYESLVNARNFYLSEEFISIRYFEHLQEYIIRLFKQTEIYYYNEYEIDDLPGIIKDIENKINYMDEFINNNENEGNENERNENEKLKEQTVYNTLNYLYELYTSISYS